MAAVKFPALAPTARSYSPGEFASTEFKALNGSITKLRYGNRRHNSTLSLTFANISDVNAALILEHYSTITVSGDWASFLPDTNTTVYEFRSVGMPQLLAVAEYSTRYTGVWEQQNTGQVLAYYNGTNYTSLYASNIAGRTAPFIVGGVTQKVVFTKAAFYMVDPNNGGPWNVYYIQAYQYQPVLVNVATAGVSGSLVSWMEESASGLRWRYASPPKVSSVKRGLSTVECEFIANLDGD